jgi:hypothetical protein
MVVSALAHTPPVVALVKVTDDAGHTDAGPVIAATDGALTVIALVT